MAEALQLIGGLLAFLALIAQAIVMLVGVIDRYGRPRAADQCSAESEGWDDSSSRDIDQRAGNISRSDPE